MATKPHPKAVAKAVKAAGINTPYWCRVVGSRLEIQPVGGKVITLPLPLPAQRPVSGKDGDAPILSGSPPTPDTSRMNRDELRALARQLKVPAASSMNKAALVAAIAFAQGT